MSEAVTAWFLGALFVLVLLILLHSMHCPGRRWSPQHAKWMTELLVARGMGQTMPAAAMSKEYDQGQVIKAIGTMIKEADDVGMRRHWAYHIAALANGDNVAMFAELRAINKRSNWLAEKSQRCHVKFLPHHWMPTND